MAPRMLLIGGGIFVGRAIAREALSRGWEVSALSRGKSLPGPPDGVTRISGDRMDRNLLGRLAETPWDAVVDTCAYMPHQLDPLLDLLAPATANLLMISTISVYRIPVASPFTEDSPLLDPSYETEFKPELYGNLKVACEQRLLERAADKSLILRPGLIVGVEDPTDRFSWWIRQMLEGGPILFPDEHEQPVQWTDVTSFAHFALKQLEQNGRGVIHAVGPEGTMRFPDLIHEMAERAHPDGAVMLRPKSSEAVLAAGIKPWEDLPLWLPREMWDLDRADCTRARKAGWTTRPLGQLLDDLVQHSETLVANARKPDLEQVFADSGLS